MKTLTEYLALPYKIEIIPRSVKVGYVIALPELPGCLTCGDTLEQALANAQDAKRCWLETALEDGIAIPEPNSVENYSGQFKLRIPKSLHKNLAEHSKQEGISMNQYCLYLLNKFDAQYQHK